MPPMRRTRSLLAALGRPARAGLGRPARAGLVGLSMLGLVGLGSVAAAPAASAAATITVTSATPLPTAAQGFPYNPFHNPLTATGGTPPYTWSLASGSSLPPGLSLSSSGVISGTPSAVGTYSFTVDVADSATPADTGSKTFSLTVISRYGSAPRSACRPGPRTSPTRPPP